MQHLQEKKWRAKKKMTRPFHEEVFPLIETSKERFYHFLLSDFRLHLGFCSLLTLELLLFLLLYPIYHDSVLLAGCFTWICFTLFIYVTLILYRNTKAEEKGMFLLDNFILECQEFIPYDWHDLEYHNCLSFGLRKFKEAIEEKQSALFRLPAWLDAFGIGRQWLHDRFFWKKFLRMKELLLQSVIQEHLEMIKLCPDNLEVHASLANAYILLSNLYLESSIPKTHQETMKSRFSAYAHFAILELSIVKEYAPHDPWVRMQLADSWRELGRLDEEIEETEALVNLRPHDIDALFHLGVLYFTRGDNKKGLEVYQTVKRFDQDKADELIGYYGIHLYRKRGVL